MRLACFVGGVSAVCCRDSSEGKRQTSLGIPAESQLRSVGADTAGRSPLSIPGNEVSVVANDRRTTDVSIKTDQNLDSQVAKLTFFDTLWTRGVESGDDTAQFGKLIDAAFDRAGNVYLLDKAAVSIRMFDHAGKFVRVVARSGRGPGELSDPQSMIHDGIGSLYVVDMQNGLQILDTKNSAGKPLRVKLPFTVRDLCLLDNRLFVFALYQKMVAHELTLSGSLVRSFGEVRGPKDFEFAREAVSSEGKIACMPDSGLVIVAIKYFPQLSAYLARTGRLVWADSLPDFVNWTILATGKSYTMLQPRTMSDVHFVLRPLTANMVLSQSRRQIRNEDETISTCVVDVRNGSCVYRTTGLPALPSTRNGEAIAITETPFPTVSLLRISLASSNDARR